MTKVSNISLRRFCLAGAAGLVVTVMFIGSSCSSPDETRNLPNAVTEISASAININTAGPETLEKIPYVGAKLANEIIEHRQKYGPFRRAEHLLLINGISDKRFREIRHLIRVD